MPISNLHVDHCQKECVQKGGNELCSGYEETKRKG